MAEKEFFIGGFRFTSDFDSGNLGRVELVDRTPENEEPRPSTSTVQNKPSSSEYPDVEFRLWTRPDCQDTEFENGNRTWFYFGMEGGVPGTTVRFTLMNLNKQTKLFSQGMAPVYLSPGKYQWERIREPPTYETVDNNFQMSFKFRTDDTRGTTYFAFTYPYMYKELQMNLDRLYRRYGNGNKTYTELTGLPDGAIYFHRENVIRSIEKRKMDLLTITGMNGITQQKEACLEHLFQEEMDNRPYIFERKKVVFVSARVHPGETCSSHVINGFIKFLLKENDVRAAMLRRKYVFKLIPMLNPDGVVNGHYRTDTLGVNLNRVYGNPSLSLNPTIYAARKLILYAHLGKDIQESKQTDNVIPSTLGPTSLKEVDQDLLSSRTNVRDAVNDFTWEIPTQRNFPLRTSSSSRNSLSSFSCLTPPKNSSNIHTFLASSPLKSDYSSQWYEMTENSRFSEGDESIADFSLPLSSKTLQSEDTPAVDFINPGNVDSKSGSRTDFLGAFLKSSVCEPSNSLGDEQRVRKGSLASTEDESNDLLKRDAGPTYLPENGESGLFMYIDIHGHASKRGIFMYGNHFDNTETKVDALLFPKLMSINSANFDFPACNFTQRNMFLKDRHTGAGREGSGRVSVYKATGITYCYTLECNFNTGRFTNNIPIASRDQGRASPPPVFDIPPKYNPTIYEETGKSLAVSILDLTESNPWTRLTCSSSKNLKGLRSWIRNYLKSAEPESSSKSRTMKSSPIRTRLRNLAGVKKSAVKQLKLTVKSPKSPESPRSLSKMPRKILSTKISQSTSGKLSRQISTGSIPDTSLGGKVSRPNSSVKQVKLKRPLSKTGGKTSTKHLSKPSSRPSSPRRSSGESRGPKGSTVKAQKVLVKRSSSKLQESSSNQSLGTPRIKKVKKKKAVST